MSEDPTPPDTGSSDPSANGDHTGSLGGLWARVVELERESRWLSAKCDELRHSCRDLLAAVGSPGPLTEEQVRSLHSDVPRVSQEEAFAEYRRLREERAAGIPPVQPGATTEQLSRQIAELRSAIAALTAHREALRPIFLALAEAFEPDAPPTEEELHDMLHGPRGRPLIEIIEEHERGLRG